MREESLGFSFYITLVRLAKLHPDPLSPVSSIRLTLVTSSLTITVSRCWIHCFFRLNHQSLRSMAVTSPANRFHSAGDLSLHISRSRRFPNRHGGMPGLSPYQRHCYLEAESIEFLLTSRIGHRSAICNDHVSRVSVHGTISWNFLSFQFFFVSIPFSFQFPFRFNSLFDLISYSVIFSHNRFPSPPP